jgi:MerR family redox-sensitive transcriptional activator SoxR
VQLVGVIQLAKDAGFTIAEIRTLIHGFDAETTPAARWQALAHTKLSELDRLLERIQSMRRLLLTGLQCGCLHWEECVIINGVGCTAHPQSVPILLYDQPDQVT